MRVLAKILFISYLLSSLLVWQSMVPGVVSMVRGPGFGFSTFLCSVSEQSASLETQRAISELLRSLGKEDFGSKPDRIQGQHCAYCVLLDLSLPVTINTGTAIVWDRTGSRCFDDVRHLASFAQGPPLGSRAPPVFL